jgi:hypothetical protein
MEGEGGGGILDAVVDHAESAVEHPHQVRGRLAGLRH